MFRFKNRSLTTYFHCAVGTPVHGRRMSEGSISFIYVLCECYVLYDSMLHVVLYCVFLLILQGGQHALYPDDKGDKLPRERKVGTITSTDYG